MDKNNYCVIMAGGIGARFWPISRSSKPKQFLDILGVGKTLLRQTFDRFSKVCLTENIYIVGNLEHFATIKEILPEIDDSQILSEPLRRNTAPCIAYSNFIIRSKNPDAKIVVAPSDHLITNEEKFIEVIKKSFEFVSQNDGLLTLGITPDKPETGYGYIQISNKPDKKFPYVQRVKTFTEKPDKQTAEAFIKSGEFFWNSGIFIWSLKSIDIAYDKYLPEITKVFQQIKLEESPEKNAEMVKSAYSECKNISVDIGIMEHAENVYVLCTEFGWSDLGTWDSIYEKSNKDENGNVILGKNVISYESTNTIIKVPDDKLVIIQGMDNFIIAESDNILMICKKNDENKIRQFVHDVKINKGEKYT